MPSTEGEMFNRKPPSEQVTFNPMLSTNRVMYDPMPSNEYIRYNPKPLMESVKLEGNLKCLFTNARNLATKMGELEALVVEELIDVVGIAETWLDSSHDWMANLQGFNLFRKDRANRRGGGVCLYVRSDMKANVKEVIQGGVANDVD